MEENRKKSDARNEPGGSEAPWQPFVRGIRGFVSKRVPTDDVDDVLQETLARLHEAASSLRSRDRVEAWVFSIARRAIADFYRGRERNPVKGTVGSAEDVAEGESPEPANLDVYDGEHSVHEEVLSWLRPMAEELPVRYRRALIMADFEGHTQQEVADELELSLSGAKSRVQRARAMLGDILRHCCEVEFGPGGEAVAFRRLEGER